jgi:hypothetical protein
MIATQVAWPQTYRSVLNLGAVRVLGLGLGVSELWRRQEISGAA